MNGAANTKGKRMSMLERVARAIAKRQSPKQEWGELTEWERGECTKDARAAIEAMREPTPTMIEARIDRAAGKIRIHPLDLEIWQDMVDAALEEPGRDGA